MAFNDISLNGKPLTIHRAITQPLFKEKTVLVTDTWEYVDLWLKRARKNNARFFWEQAQSFYEATQGLDATAAPLTAYYCFLNATKALLIAKGVQASDAHGVTGHTVAGPSSLSNEKVKFKPGGVLAALCTHLGETSNDDVYTLRDVLYNLPYIHRAFDITFSASAEIFMPISSPQIVRSTSNHQAWFIGEFREKYANQHSINKLPADFEQEHGDPERFLFRFRPRFNWRPNDRSRSLERYRNYHRRLRKHLYYIYGPQRLWYLKRGGNVGGLIQRASLTLTFAAMHKLSELSRYTPDKLARHLDCQHNWLLSEFIQTAPSQFIDEISSELTGREFMIPGRASRK